MTLIFGRSVLSRAGMVACAIGLLALCPRGVAAQICDQASKTLLDPTSKRMDLYNAAQTIVACGDLAPGTIVAALRRAPINSTLDTLVRFDAFSLFDRRLADSIRALAVDPNEGKARRIMYLQLLTRYAAPQAGVDTSAVTAKRFTAIVIQPHSQWIAGSQPLTASDRANARSTILSMAMNDPDANLRELAMTVYHDLENFPP